MKKRFVLLPFLALFAISGCTKGEVPSCTHQDANHDGTCDLCGETGLEVKHVDANNDFTCDVCQKELASVGIALDTSEVTKVFARGAEFEAEGLKVIETSEAGSTRELSFTLSEPDMSTGGEKTVVVTFGEGENDKLEYTINVVGWSEEDLEVFDYASYTSIAPLPFIEGHNMRTEAVWEGEGEEKELVSWKIVADNMTSEEYLDYYNGLEDYNGTEVEFDGDDLYMLLDEITSIPEDYHGLSSLTAFVLHPSEMVEEDGEYYPERYFLADEYITMGLNEENQLVIENRFVNALMDGYFEYYLGFSFLNGWEGRMLPPAYNDFITLIPAIVDHHYSELSAIALMMPDIVGKDISFVPVSYKTLYPLDESLDDYDEAMMLYFEDFSKDEADAYCASLVEFGFTKVEANEEEKTPEYYYFEDELYGYIEFYPEYEAIEYQGQTYDVFTLEFYFIAPEVYTYKLDLGFKYLGHFLGCDFSIDNKYAGYGMDLGDAYASAGEFENGGEFAEAMARAMMEEGFEVVNGLTYIDDDEDNDPYYGFEVVNEDYDFMIFVDEAPVTDEEGKSYFYVDVKLFEGGEVEFTNAELALKAFYEKKFAAKPLLGVDYFASEDEETEEVTYIITIADTESEASLEGLQAATEAFGGYLPEEFKLGDSASGGEQLPNVWTTEFDYIAGSVKVTVIGAYLYNEETEESSYMFIIGFQDFIFMTPESAAEDFVKAATGAAPEEGAIVEKDGTYTYHSSMSGEFENLEAVAAAFAGYLPEGFTLTYSGEGASEEPTWVQEYEFEELHIKATVVVGDEEENYFAYVRFEYIYPELPLEQIVGFFADASIPNVVVPNYSLSNPFTEIEVDDSSELYYDIYLTGSNHQEMVDYKDDLLEKGWTVIGTSPDGDYRLQYLQTNAYVDLLDYGDYILVSFWFKEVKTGMSPEEALTAFGLWIGSNATPVEEGVYGVYQAFPATGQEPATVADIKDYVDGIIGLDDSLAAEFKAVLDWTAKDDDNIKYFINDVNTVIEVHVYESTVYVKDGAIVPAETEGAVATEVICVEAYSYTHTPSN